jgi:DNA processing protein
MPFAMAGDMLSRLDAIALALLWTGQAAGRPVRRDDPAVRPGALPAGRRLREVNALAEAIGPPGEAGGHGPEGETVSSLRARARRADAEAERAGLSIVAFGDPAYPDLLAQIPDPPPAVWVAGLLPPHEARVAIVGSRTATPHGLEVASRLGEDLARAGICVVSGLARGVDASAHRGALRGGGPTIAVLGCGANVVYPPEHVALAREIAARGAVVSEFAPGTPPRGWHFPRRNRIISGLCTGVVVVEASDHSGSLITARCALAQGREVLAVPSGVLSGRNRGAHALLRDGAAIVEGVDDILQALAFEMRDVDAGEDTAKPRAPEAWLRAMIEAEPYDLEALCSLSGLDPVRLLARLSQLEITGWIRRDEGGRFVKLAGNVLR